MPKEPMFFTDEEKALITQGALDAISGGKSLRSYCIGKDLTYSMVWNWLDALKDGDNSPHAHARMIGTHYLTDECIDISDEKGVDPQEKRIRIDTRLRLAGKWNRKDYGDKLDTDMTSGGEKLNINIVRFGDNG